jgi:hypothetical protein
MLRCSAEIGWMAGWGEALGEDRWGLSLQEMDERTSCEIMFSNVIHGMSPDGVPEATQYASV